MSKELENQKPVNYSPPPWTLKAGWEQCDPGLYILDAEGAIIYAEDSEEIVARNITGNTTEFFSKEDLELIVLAVNSYKPKVTPA